MKILKTFVESITKTEIEKLVEALKKHPICRPMNDLKEREEDKNVLIWLNPNNQHCFNFGWYTYQDYYDWMEGKGKIVKGKTDEEKKKFWDVAIFEAKYDLGWAIGYYKKYFDLIDDTFHPKMKETFGMARYVETPIKITKTNHHEIISKMMGNICKWYGDTTVEIRTGKRNYEKMSNELQGVKQVLYTLGVGYYGAINTPCEIENLSWISDICIYKAAYLYFVKNEIPLPDFDFVFNYKE